MIQSCALTMNYSRTHLMKLPDELLLIILKKLDNIDVLFSLMGLDTRLDQIIRDPCFTAEIDLIQLNDNETCGLVDTYIDRFCLDILPEIHHHIKWLKVQSTSMERLLLAADYSNLSQLDIFIPHEEPIPHFDGKETLALSSALGHLCMNTCPLLLSFEQRFSLPLSLSLSLSRLAIHARSTMGSFFPVLRRNCAHWSICDITEHKCVTVLTLRPDAKKLRLTAADCAVCDAMRPQLCRRPHTATKCEEIVTCSCVASSSLLVDLPSRQDRISSGSY